MRYEKELMGSSSLRDAMADVPQFDDARSVLLMKVFECILSTGSYPQSGLPAFIRKAR